MSDSITLRSCMAVLALSLLAGPAFGQTAKLYWTETDHVQRSNLDGTGVETIAMSSGGNQDIELDVVAGKVYWANTNSGEIRRRNLDGTGSIEAFNPSGTAPVQGIGLDAEAGHIYFTTTSQPDRLSRADLDPFGDNEINVVHFSNPSGTAPWDVDVDRISATAKLYWPDFALGPLRRSDLDGMSIETVAGMPGDASTYVAVDVSGDWVYWNGANTNSVRRVHLDGSGVETIQTAGSLDRGLALDLVAGKLYYHEQDDIYRINLDGSGAAEPVVTSLLGGVGLAILPAAIAPVPALQGVGIAGLGLVLMAAAALTLQRHRMVVATQPHARRPTDGCS